MTTESHSELPLGDEPSEANPAHPRLDTQPEAHSFETGHPSGPSAEPVRHQTHGQHRPALERDAMAWPPAPWERAPTAWRDDLWQEGHPPPPIPSGHSGPTRVYVPPIARPDGGDATMDEPDKAARTRGMLRDVTETVLLTALIFFAIRAVIQNFKIEGSSMLPTLESGQYVLVNKLAFAGFGEPHRGDIVVFESWSDPEKDYIKRIIGLPGETVEIKDRRVFIDKAPLAEPYLDPPSTSPAYGPLVLGEDEYFVLGDNRGNSSDSRQHDAMSEEQLIGKAWVTYWPPPAMSFVPDGEDSYADGDGTQTGGLEQGDDADSEGSADDEEDNSFFGFGDSFFGEGDERDEGAEGDDVNGDGESDGAQESGDTGDESGG